MHNNHPRRVRRVLTIRDASREIGRSTLPVPAIHQLLDEARFAHPHFAVDVEHLAAARRHLAQRGLRHLPDGLPFRIAPDEGRAQRALAPGRVGGAAGRRPAAAGCGLSARRPAR